jgi:signal transduction histidine kinase
VVGEWDRDRLGQVVANLLENTSKYGSGEGEVVVRVEDGGDVVRLAVTDRGPGIAPEHLPRLFDRFYRADATGAGGLGLGLYISRMLVEAHGGKIWAESEVGQGSTFTVSLPKRT